MKIAHVDEGTQAESVQSTQPEPKKFNEIAYVVDRSVALSYLPQWTEHYKFVFDGLDEAVHTGEEIEVGIYQLIRIAKFKKTAIEIKTLTEIK